MRRSLKVISLLMLVMVMGLTACSSGSKNGSSGESGGKVDLSMTIWGSEDEKKILSGTTRHCEADVSRY